MVGDGGYIRSPLMNVVLEISTMAIMWTAAILGNSLVCVVIHRSRRLQSTTNYFVVSLASSDMCFAIISIPFVLVESMSDKWVFGVAMCKIVRFVQWLVPFTTVAVLSSICVDRFYTIIYPLSFKVTRDGAKRMILGAWVVGLILSCPTLYFYDISTIDGVQHCKKFTGIVYFILSLS